MLIFESEGFCEVDNDHVEELYRSSETISVTADNGDSFELHAVVCRHTTDQEPRCHVGFFCRSLKRAVVFAARNSSARGMVQTGLEAVQQLGLQMEPVQLNLSPAMRQVVLRDIPGLQTPEQARRAAADRKAQLAQLQTTLDDEGPDSAAGKRAALKINAEKRIDEKSAMLRELLCRQFAPANVPGHAELEVLSGQVEDLTGRLAKSEVLYREERAERELLEGLMAAAEKRIQELEEVLVDAETISADALKQKQRIVKLQGEVKELTGQLSAAQTEAEHQSARYEELVAEIKAAQLRIAGLEKELADATEIAAGAIDAEQQLQQTEQHVAALQAELSDVQARLEHEQTARRQQDQQQADLHAQLDALRQTLAETEERSNTAEAERSGEDARLAALQQRFDQAVADQSNLRDELEQERIIRQRLEKGAVADQKRIEALEAELGGSGSGLVLTAGGGGALATQQIELLKAELRDALAEQARDVEQRAELENELDEAHRLIETLERALKESRAAAARPPAVTPPVATAAAADEEVQRLTDKLSALESELARERRGKESAVSAQQGVEQRLNDLETRLLQAVQSQATAPVVAAAPPASSAPPAAPEPAKPTKPAKPLPHELRPAPKKGAKFHPDWDLQGLPCRSTEQIIQAWASVYNVQLSLEGYPSQYCAAFMVVLKQNKQKRLYLLFNLKKDRHLLVCIPAAQPRSDAELKKTIEDGKRYLQLSGFEIEAVEPADLAGTLGSYVLAG
ncbi:MAG: hypothetical protein RQ723_04350 [Desulfuromonadales bacterium]|nr:hypothetical protein [Desulfuromonadales bacterium]